MSAEKFNNNSNNNKSNYSSISNRSNSSDNKLQENDIHTLTNMGFTIDQSVRALIENDCNVEIAANFLLGKWG